MWDAINNCKRFWNSLDEKQKNKARGLKGFKDKIEKTLLSEKWNDACVEMAANSIEHFVSLNSQALTEITLDENQKQNELKNHLENFKKAKDNLNSEQYQGRDSLFFNSKTNSRVC